MLALVQLEEAAEEAEAEVEAEEVEAVVEVEEAEAEAAEVEVPAAVAAADIVADAVAVAAAVADIDANEAEARIQAEALLRRDSAEEACLLDKCLAEVRLAGSLAEARLLSLAEHHHPVRLRSIFPSHHHLPGYVPRPSLALQLLLSMQRLLRLRMPLRWSLRPPTSWRLVL